MPAKDRITWENRRIYILDRVNDVLQEIGHPITFTLEELEKGMLKHHPDFVEVKKRICERYLFCDYRSFDNMLNPWQCKEQQTSLFQPKTNQLQLFNNN
ncbi:hypothetical protein P8625_02895 [Tenacibaculum tangerinum]|uniref:Uncharacterized protein n=1 Tax=Tenacibaculum tangerinum TaxID=3038772 RepID=A0ABY8L4D9_9FLAO|nr:hypothetical protein [Tenacibaculum tangerinum]WGH76131.1 hypothetical protein P8625_02895 [Tenacibaculum tangerinum]